MKCFVEATFSRHNSLNYKQKIWLWRLDSNQGMAESKSAIIGRLLHEDFGFIGLTVAEARPAGLQEKRPGEWI
jgi:hypothetical protein